jgi:hypothetical protein
VIGDGPSRHERTTGLPGRVRHLGRSWLSEKPAIYLPLARRRYPGPSPQVIGADTDLVIDGYTRAASTHVVYALQLAQPAPVRIAHHLHAPAQLIAAARRGVPALLLVREPDGTALSQAAREPHVTVRDALLAHARFHERLLPYRDAFVTADFADVTEDLRPAVQALNDRFGMTFHPPVIEDEQPLLSELIGLRPTHWPTLLGFESGLVSKQELLAALEDPERRPPPPADSDLWLPSDRRRQAMQELRAELERPELRGVRRRARAAYDAFTGAGATAPA